MWFFVFFVTVSDRFRPLVPKDQAMQPKRHTAILRLLEEAGTLSIAELAKRLGVSAETVRRDLRALTESGEVQRMHGAASLPATLGEAPFRRRMRANAAAKQAIARALAATVKNGDVLMMDTGTTTSFLARALVGHSRLTVLTNSTDAARILAAGPGNRVLVPGGQLRPDSGAILGEEAVAFLDRHSAQLAVISAGAVEGDEVMDFDPAEAAFARAMLARAERRVVATDASKFGKRGLATVCRFAALSGIVTEAPLPPAEAAQARAAGLAVTVAGR
jgi:DeoR family glycerol-3-phosphate regulon repressor